MEELVVKAVRSDTLLKVLDFLVDELIAMGYKPNKLFADIANRYMERRLTKKKS